MLSYGPCLKIFQKYRPTLTSYNDTLYDHETFVRLPLHRQELEANVQALDYIDCERKEHLLNIWNLEKNIKRNNCSEMWKHVILELVVSDNTKHIEQRIFSI